MSLVPYKLTALTRLDTSGLNIIPYASASVLNRGTGTYSTLKTDSTGATPLSNPFTCDANGEKEFWANGGNYSISVAGGQSWDISLNGDSDITKIDTWASISSVTPSSAGQLFTLAQHTSGGLGGGTLMAFSGSVTDDGGTQKNALGGFYLKRVNIGCAVTDAMFGGIGNGVADDTLSIGNAVTYLVSIGGGKLYLLGNSYLLNGLAGADGILNGILIPFVGGSDAGATSTSIEIIGQSRDTWLIPGSNNMNAIRLSASYCSVRNLSIMNNNSKTGVNALSLIPENITTPALNSQQSRNQIENLYIYNCAEAVLMQCGNNGGCYYNKFSLVDVHGNSQAGTRGFYFKSGIGGASSNVNRNQFFSCTVSFAERGFHLESGDTNSFYGCSAEGILYGTAKTAIQIDNVDANGRGNEANRFYGFVAESCTTDLICNNPRTHFFGCSLDAAKSTVSSTFGVSGTFIGGYDDTLFPTIVAGAVNNSGVLPTGLLVSDYPTAAFSGGFPKVDLGGKLKAFVVTSANVLNTISIDSNSVVYYSIASKYVHFTGRIMFKPTANNSTIRVTLPIAPLAALYTTFSTVKPFKFVINCSGAGGAEFAAFGQFDATGVYLDITLPSGSLWDVTAGNNNYAAFDINYYRA